MKKSILFIALLLICFGLKSIAANPDVCYVKTSDKVYFGQDVKIGMIHTKIISDDGTVRKIKNNDVLAYMHENKLYELLPVICEKGDTICKALMEQLSSRGDFKLYKYKCQESGYEQCAYFVFKDGNLYLKINQLNADSILPFFGLKALKVC
jgi:hypothetical protein